MKIGRIVDLPMGSNAYARVRDEYGAEYTVHAGELPKDASVGDNFAYKVDIFRNRTGPATTLTADE